MEVVFLILLLFALLLIILGVVMRSGKASFLIAGYNTMPKKKKDKYDKNALSKFIANLNFIIAGFIIFIAVAIKFFSTNIKPIVNIGTILFVIVAIIAVIYMNTGNRFKKQS